MKSDQSLSGRRQLLSILTLVSLVTAACGITEVVGLGPTGSESFGAGEDFSILAALAEIPNSTAIDDPMVVVYVTDLVAAGEADGLARPTGSVDSEEVVQWIQPMTGFGESTIAGHVPGMFRNSVMDLAGFREEVGFSISDVDAVVELANSETSLIVVAGDLSPNGMDTEVADGVGTIGEGDDFFMDLENSTTARDLGRPLRVGQNNELVALAQATWAIED